jgi:hypothetical protein
MELIKELLNDKQDEYKQRNYVAVSITVNQFQA